MKITVKKFNRLTINQLYEIMKLRCNVFVVEQNCVYPDLDDVDKQAYHVFIEEAGEIVAYARVIDKGNRLDEVSIGRVISAKRRQGYGTLVMEKAIETAKKKFGAHVIKIGAQAYAIPFYQSLGFEVVSEQYLEDGIPHFYMIYKQN